MRKRQNYGGLDTFRLLAALLVIAIHTSPLASVSEGADFFLTRILARVAVPFFLMVTGQFVAAGFLAPSARAMARLHKFIQKTMVSYIFCILLYLPVGIYAGHYKDMSVGTALRMVLFDGTFYHLWYFPACILGIFLVHLMSRFLNLQGMTIVSLFLYLIGLFGDSYYGLAQKVPILETVYGGFFQIFSYTRNGLFLAPLFLVLGMWMAVGAEKDSRLSRSPLILSGGLAASFAAMTGEAFLLRHFGLQRHDSMYFALVPVMFFLYKCLLSPQAESKKGLRTAAFWIYILHPGVIVAVRGIAKPLHLTGILVDNSLIHYIAVALLSVAAGLIISFISGKAKPSLLLSRITAGKTGRGPRRAGDGPSYEKGEYDTEYQEAPGMQADVYENNYGGWDPEMPESREEPTEGYGDGSPWQPGEEAGNQWQDSGQNGGSHWQDSAESSSWSSAEDSGALRQDFAEGPPWGSEEDGGTLRQDSEEDSPWGSGLDGAPLWQDFMEDSHLGAGQDGGSLRQDFPEGPPWDSGLDDGPQAGRPAENASWLPAEGIHSQIGDTAESSLGHTKVWDVSPTEDPAKAGPAAGMQPPNTAEGENLPGTRPKTVASARYQGTPGTDHLPADENIRYPSQAMDGSELFAETREFAPSLGTDTNLSGTPKEIDADDYVLKIMSGKKAPAKQAALQQTRPAGPQDRPAYTENTDVPWEAKPQEPQPPSESACSRAWIELDAEALRQNVELFRARIPQHCRLMPAVKANAYGHGIVPISRLLDSMGVDAYSVACISEGIELRKSGIRGKILILGYTSPEDFSLLRFYRLTQTVVDAPYARELDKFGGKLHVHIGIDTGMHRIGIRCEDIDEITAVYRLKNLVVDGLFTHLCVSDSPHPQHKAFTAGQLRAFYQVTEILKAEGYPCPTLHILASYGILNLLPDRNGPGWQNKRPSGSRTGLDAEKLAADFVRPGIALYGVLSTAADQNVWKGSLKPVLSLKAKVASVRPLHAGESVSYGITYTAPLDMQIAAITIGYADGLPRELSNGRGYFLINGRRAPIIGRICMDQCIVDISRIPGVKQGDTAVIIGRSGKEEITAAQIAETCGTITHEILTGLAARLGRVVKEPS